MASARSTSSTGRATSNPQGPRGKNFAVPEAAPHRLTREKLLAWGAAVCALMALAGLSLAGLIVLLGLGYFASAFFLSPERRDRSLIMSGWAFAAAFFLGGLVPNLLLLTAVDTSSVDAVALFGTQVSVRLFLAFAVVGWIAIGAGAVFMGRAFSRQGSNRYRLLSWAGLCVAVYYLCALPRTISVTTAAPEIGALWEAPAAYATVLCGTMAGLVIYRAFGWSAAKASGSGGVRYAQREFLLAAAALLMLLPQFIGLGLQEWRPSQLVTGMGTVASSWTQLLGDYASTLMLPLFLLSLAVGFFVSCRHAGWTPDSWLETPRAPEPARRLPATAQPEATEEAGAPGWSERLLLTWRLPLLFAWLLLLVAACTIAGYYGFVAVAPAAVHYSSMLLYHRKSAANTGATSAT
jgi:hypothetical protein